MQPNETIVLDKKFYSGSAKEHIKSQYIGTSKVIIKSGSNMRIRGLVKPGRIAAPKLLPKELRDDPFADPPPITDKDL